MEWRALVAITLSILVLMLFQIYFAPKQNGVPPIGGVNNTSKTVSGQDTGAHSIKGDSENSQEGNKDNKGIEREKGLASFKGAGNAVPNRPLKTITIETPLWRASFSEEGGAITSFYLKRYRQSVDPSSEPINIIDSISPYWPFSTGIRTKTGFVPVYFSSEEGDGLIRFSGSLPDGRVIDKIYRFNENSYWLDLELRVKGAQSLDPAKEAAQPTCIVLANSPFLKESRYSFKGISLFNADTGLQEIKLDDGEKEGYKGQLKWISIGDKYFFSSLIPLTPNVMGWDVEMTHYKAVNGLDVAFLSPVFSSHARGVDLTLKFGLFLGPKEIGILKQAGHDLDKAINFGWFDALAKPLLYFLKFIYKFTNNYGIAIIVLTIIIKIAFWPLAHKSAKSMKTMQKLQPRLKKLKEKYGNDSERLNKELLQLYKTYKVNPMSGCLPMLLQIPVFFALYKVLLQAVELRHAPFFMWINDLSAPDRLMIPGVHIPMIDGIPVLTILMGASMWWQQRLTPASLDPTQAKLMQFLPVIFTFMFLTFPSGLVLYWLVNNVLSVAQQHYINKFTD